MVDLRALVVLAQKNSDISGELKVSELMGRIAGVLIGLVVILLIVKVVRKAIGNRR